MRNNNNIIIVFLEDEEGQSSEQHMQRCGGYGTGWVSMAAGTMTMLLF